MKFHDLLTTVRDEPVFDTGFLLAGTVDPDDVRRQLSRWQALGRIYQLRRGLYTLAPPFQKVQPHPFLVANRLVRGSYVSLQSALAYYGLIPEYVPITTSVTTCRPGGFQTQLGSYDFRHIKTSLFYGYRSIEVAPTQRAFVATPEKALLDLIYLQPGADSPAYLQELRLQNVEQLDWVAVEQLAQASESPKLLRAATQLQTLAQTATEYQAL